MSESKSFRTALLPGLIYPATMLGCITLHILLNQWGLSLLAAGYIPVLLGAVIIIFFERSTPARPGWRPDKDDIRNDLLYMLIPQILLPKLLTLLTALLTLRFAHHYGWAMDGLWIHHWPIGVQVVLMILFADLLRYGLHMASHKSPLLWRLHAVHHSPQKLYWMNVGRFHPLEKALQFMFDAFPFIFLGISEEVLTLYFVFYAINGFFQHCNIKLRFGGLNYLISTPELHRWHHSRVTAESNANYGNNIIIWDLVFGTWFLPPDRKVESLGLINPDYPTGFGAQLKTPFINQIDKESLPVGSWMDLVRNALLHHFMSRAGYREYAAAKDAARHPRETQERVLLQILRNHAGTYLGEELGLKNIPSIEMFQQNIPVHDYDMLRPYIDKQERTKEPWLNIEQPIMYNRTSGTTSEPKYIPVLPATLESFKRGQRLFSYVQYRAHPAGFKGSILGMVSPAEEEQLETGTPVGSASGHVYRRMPWLTRGKYVVPYEVFEIEDYDIKYYTIALLALMRDDITYMATANPSTFLRLLETVKNQKTQLVADMQTGSYQFEGAIPRHISRVVLRKLRSGKKRAPNVAAIFAHTESPTFSELWPCLQTVVTWTGGSCGVALENVKKCLPAETRIFDLGYLASELRGTVTIDPDTHAGLPTLRENFFEFVEKETIDQRPLVFYTLDQLIVGKTYFIYVTTPAGLIRFDMNDLVQVVGKFQNTPTLRFVQKGAGVTNITGEKMYETQMLQALENIKPELNYSIRFVQVLADPLTSVYRAYIEIGDPERYPDLENTALRWNDELGKLNIEYAAKRSSGRLRPLQIIQLKPGAFEAYKQHALGAGQRESQFKTVALRYADDFHFNLEPWHAN